MAARRKFLFDCHQSMSFCKEITTLNGDEVSTQLLEIKDLELEQSWSLVLSSYEAFVLEDEKNDHDFNDSNGKKFEEARKLYQTARAKIMFILCSRNQRDTHSEIQPQQFVHSLKLPPCDTPPFEGGYSKWPAFRDIFTAVFGNHPHLSPAQKLYHLRGKTRGEAFEIVKKFELVDSNFDLAWEALKVRYENRRILVNQQMKKLFGVQSVQNESPKSIRMIQSAVGDSLSIFKTYGISVDNWDPLIIHLVSSKIPEETLRAWEDSLNDHKELPTWQQMESFLSKRVEKLETIIDFRKPNQRENHNSKSHSFHTTTESSSKTNFCKRCHQKHSLMACKYFKALAPKERLRYAMANRYCLNCLSTGHFKSKCTSTKLCLKCDEKHHTMLHFEMVPSKEHQRSASTSGAAIPREGDQASTSADAKRENSFLNTAEPVDEVNTLFTQGEGATILPTARVELEHGGERFAVRALLDSGSEKSFISKRLQQKLKIPIEYYNSQISGLGGTVVGNSKGRCSLKLHSRLSDFHICIKALVVSSLAHFLPSRPIRTTLEKVKHLNLADPNFYVPAPIDLIIGSDYLPFINKKGIVLPIVGGIEARESHFGWYLFGPATTEPIHAFSTFISPCEENLLHDQLKKFWEVEEVERSIAQSNEDIWCEDFYKNTTYRDPDGRYVVRLPFKKEYPEFVSLGSSRNMALAQYCRMEATLRKNPELKLEYDKVLREYITLNHMTISSDYTGTQTNYFLPHHAVIRPESKTTKIRVVFNGSKRTTSGHSLNDVLYSGPILQRDLMKIILNWRYYKYVFNGDIQKMYRQIWVHKDDQRYQQILFRADEHGPIEPYRLKTVTFGVNAAPFLAIRTLIQLSQDCKQEYPKASDILQKETYVDDILSGGHSLEETKTKQIQVQKALLSAGFPLKKITSNNITLLENWPREDLLNEEFLRIEEKSATKTLGIRWNAVTDSFFYAIDPIKLNDKITKRKILSCIAKLFDPLGWIGPIIITAKILMQDLWHEKIDWDEAVAPHIFNKWYSFIQNLQSIPIIKIDRWVNFSPHATVQIHGFSDASEKAYCATVYLRTTDDKNIIHSHLLVAKTKVAPVKKLTIPKLELCGARLLTKLLETVVREVAFDYEIFLWTDSAIVLGWLQKTPQTLKTFVSNKVSEILSIANINQWRYVNTKDNPADLGSRGCPPRELANSQLWWHGPPWLTQEISKWPEPRTFEPTDLETKKVSAFHMKIVDESIIQRFSSLNRCLRVLSYIFRFIKASRKEVIPNGLVLRQEEIQFVRIRLISLAQRMVFSKEIQNLRENQPISRQSKLLTVTPFLDEHGMLRVGGRLTNSGLRYDEMHPIILPAKSKFTELLIDFTHKILLHSEHHVMLRAVRQGYYIPRVRNLIRKCIRNCKQCTIFKHRMQNQLMAPLPTERVQFSLPFTYTGVDFAGPFNIRASTVRNAKILKGYAAVFVCFTTKAVHLESCSELSANAFVATFSRFAGRRGLPKTIFSDNGRNFVGASYKLLKEHQQFLQVAEKVLADKYALHGFSWSFIPPYAPHMGGLWEAAVKSMKTHLKKIAANQSFTFEEFTTLLVTIESILNSRPLTAITENPNELNPLTPGHFLRGAPIIAPPESTSLSLETNISLLNRWQRLKVLQRTFALRWKNEYISELQRRMKWKTTKENVKQNDFVIIKDDLLPPTEWRLGRVVKLFYGTDNKVRVANILTKAGIITRPIVKLCILPNQSPSGSGQIQDANVPPLQAEPSVKILPKIS
ncbi:uncharacterized protein LOC142225306 [Haematobia irritans]|uniref:uncharacterized protein LOC142225306 n=1 Tax=Haematobia irritans TaxID=7368 RepID=UPI003F4FADF2